MKMMKLLSLPLKSLEFKIERSDEPIPTKRLAEIEVKLNKAKSLLDDFIWLNTSHPEYQKKRLNDSKFFDDLSGVTDKADLDRLWTEFVYARFTKYIQIGDIIRIARNYYDQKVITNAWLKAYEFYRHKKITAKRVFFNAEFPGNFILAWLYYNKGKDTEWFANSFVPDDDKSLLLGDVYGIYENNPDNWVMNKLGIDGDVTNLDNINKIVEYVGEDSIDLYTSDGGLNTAADEFDKQEQMQIRLKYGEVYTGARLISRSGTMFIKMFTLFTSEMQFLIQFLVDNFDDVRIYKPYTSKPANSEIYVIASGKKSLIGIEKIEELLTTGSIEELPKITIDLLPAIRSIHGTYQIMQIKRNAQLFVDFLKNHFTIPTPPNTENWNQKYVKIVYKSLDTYYGKRMYKLKDDFFTNVYQKI